jgi:hypothetical protein
VRGKEHRRHRSDARGKALPDRLQALGESLGQLGMVGPAVDEVHLNGAGTAIKSYAGAGILRCKTNNNC